MYLPILTLRTSGIPRCRIASRTALPCGSSTAAFGITITFAFIISRYLSASTRTSAIRQRLHSFSQATYFRTTTSSAPARRSTFTPTSPSSCLVSKRSTRASPTLRSRMLTLGRKAGRIEYPDSKGRVHRSRISRCRRTGRIQRRYPPVSIPGDEHRPGRTMNEYKIHSGHG
jgi:hypothetical protein